MSDNRPTPKAKPKYEVISRTTSSEYAMATIIAEYGEKGWEVITITHAMSGACSTYTAFFERYN